MITSNKTNQGFIGLVVLIVIGAVAASYFLKDKNGISYFNKLTHSKEEVMKEVDGYKTLMKNHDAEIEKNMK